MASSSNLLLALKPNTTACGICGAHFTHPITHKRWQWSHIHALTHSEHEHKLFASSQLTMYPEAAQLLQHIAIPLLDLVTSPEVAQALKEAPAPCTTK
jgi:hypothetical protein